MIAARLVDRLLLNPGHRPFLPTEEQKFLLKAALLAGEEAFEMWRAWRARVDMDRIDDNSIRLLPLACENLGARINTDPCSALIKGVRRRAWYTNHLLMHSGREVLKKVRVKGIPVLLLKGAALILTCYGKYGVRYMSDFDICVPQNRADETAAILRENGWRFRGPFTYESMRFFKHGAEFYSDTFGRVDLHWNLMHELRGESVDEEFWARAVPIAHGEVDALVLDPTDHIIHLCLHAARRHRGRFVQWIADVIAVLRRPGVRIEWNRFEKMAEKEFMKLPLYETLKYLKDHFQVPVSARTTAFFENAEASAKEIREYAWRVTPFLQRGRRGWFGNLSWHWHYYSWEMTYHRDRKPGIFAHVLGFVSFLKHRRKAGNYPEMVLHFLAGILKKAAALVSFRSSSLGSGH